ncbi:Ig-like domain repeat protein, partial [Streptomyces sp. NPDC051133]|uniref:Ig-like domain repeat protein n=1 Tax=Streptomyces sp. NPDC051133 TaxID=3155521 RepID=UPI003428F764
HEDSPLCADAYVTNMNSNTVSVIDTAGNTVTTTVPVGNGPAGVAIAAATTAPTTTTVSSSLNPSSFGQPVMFTATVTNGTATPTGTITFKDGTTTLGTRTLDSTGKATLTTSALSVGTHTITAVYNGDFHHQPSTSAPLTQTVNQAPTSLTAHTATLTLSNLGRRLTVTGLSAALTSNGSPVAGQTITFANRSGRITLCTAVTDADGTATCTAIINNRPFANGALALDLLTRGYKATYGGSSNFAASTAVGRVRLHFWSEAIPDRSTTDHGNLRPKVRA